MIYCGIHQAGHTPAEWAACMATPRPPVQPGQDGEEQ